MTEAVFYGRSDDGFFLPGWGLFQASRDGYIMKKGDWGLVQCNDPTFVWSVDPVSDPTFGMTEADEERELKDPNIELKTDLFYDRFEEFNNAMQGRVSDGWALMDAAIKAGFNPEDHFFNYWLFHKLGHWIETHHPEAPMSGLRSKEEPSD